MSATNVGRTGKRGNICVRNIVSSFATTLSLHLSQIVVHVMDHVMSGSCAAAEESRQPHADKMHVRLSAL